MSHTQAFCKAARLLTPYDFKQVFNRVSFRLSSASLVILVRSRTAGMARLGLIVARKNARRSVDRNRIKRIARESFRKNQRALGCYDYVVMTRPGVVAVSNPALNAELDRLWRDAQQRIRSFATDVRS
jgi:ribonuclease P protein component